MTRSTLQTMVRHSVRGFLAVVAVLFVAGFVSLAVWPPINDVSTGATPEYPDIQPRSYRFSQARVAAGAQEALSGLDGLTLGTITESPATDTTAAETVITATARSRSGLFEDDVTIRVQANGNGGAIVFVRSQSRVGKGDFGQNARTIRRIQAAMDDNLGTT